MARPADKTVEKCSEFDAVEVISPTQSVGRIQSDVFDCRFTW